MDGRKKEMKLNDSFYYCETIGYNMPQKNVFARDALVKRDILGNVVVLVFTLKADLRLQCSSVCLL